MDDRMQASSMEQVTQELAPISPEPNAESSGLSREAFMETIAAEIAAAESRAVAAAEPIIREMGVLEDRSAAGQQIASVIEGHMAALRQLHDAAPDA